MEDCHGYQSWTRPNSLATRVTIISSLVWPTTLTNSGIVYKNLLRYPGSILSKFTDHRAILCKGLDYPPVQPKPVMNTLQFHLPLCDANTDKSSLEVSTIFHLKAFLEGCIYLLWFCPYCPLCFIHGIFCLFRVSIFRHGCFLADLEWILGQHKSSTSWNCLL